jgi:hypothetical protein
MKQVVLVVVPIFLSFVAFAQPGLQKLWESDSVSLQGPESALFDPISYSLYVSSMKSGSIVRIRPDGKLIKADWVTGLESNKGSALYKDLLYTAETAGIAVIDVKKAALIKRIPIDGAVNLNDVAIDEKGVLYVSDTRAGKVYRMENHQPKLYLDSLPGANGLLAVKKDLYVVTSTSLKKIDANKITRTIADGFESGLDGIVMLSKNEFILSNYKGMLYYVKAGGSKQLLLDSRKAGIMANDISYNRKTKTLYVPSFASNCIIAYKVTRQKKR